MMLYSYQLLLTRSHEPLSVQSMLLDSRRTKFSSEPKHDVPFRCSIGAVEIDFDISHGNSVAENADFLVDEFEDKGVSVDEQGVVFLRRSIRNAIEAHQSKIEAVFWKIHDRHDMDKVDKIFAAKIYPSNVNTAIPEGARLECQMYKDRMDPKDGKGRKTIKDKGQALDEAVKTFSFTGSPFCISYGPARRMFAGAGSALAE